MLWQVGTNAVLRDNPLGPVDRLVHDGIARIKALGADVVLIDPQFAPKVIAKADAEDMVNLISAEAKQANVDLFPRFAVMREWHDRDGIPFEAFLSPDLLHMNDWSYGCIAKLLAASISEAATRPFASARASGVHAAPPHGALSSLMMPATDRAAVRAVLRCALLTPAEFLDEVDEGAQRRRHEAASGIVEERPGEALATTARAPARARRCRDAGAASPRTA